MTDVKPPEEGELPNMRPIGEPTKTKSPIGGLRLEERFRECGHVKCHLTEEAAYHCVKRVVVGHSN